MKTEQLTEPGVQWSTMHTFMNETAAVTTDSDDVK